MPDWIGRYRLESLLGEGGFAKVWKAHDQDLDDWVALKVLHEHQAGDPEVARKVVEEARILRKLDSDRIVRVHTIDTTDPGRPWFVLEYADGGTLENRMKDRGVGELFSGRGPPARPYTVAGALELAVEIADCLTVVHDHNVVHRDLKPSNVLFRSVGNQRRENPRQEAQSRGERMLLGDFGIARRLDIGVTGSRAGTPLYMAPEVVDPRARTPIDRRADVYAAAVILHELLTGRVPGPQPLDTLRPEVPAGLRSVVDQAWPCPRRTGSSRHGSGASSSATGCT